MSYVDTRRKYIVSIMIARPYDKPKYVDLFVVNINPKIEGSRLLEIINEGLELAMLEKVKGFHYRQEDYDMSWVNQDDLDTFYSETEYAFRHYDLGKFVQKKDRWTRIIVYHDDLI